jgi:hypothetical protein
MSAESIEAAGAWLWANAAPLLIGGAIAAVAELAFKELIWDEIIAPSLRYRLSVFKRSAKKWVRNPSFDFTHSANIRNMEESHIPKEKVIAVLDVLKDNKIPARRLHDVGIRFDNLQVGKLNYAGTIEFDTDSRERYLTALTITIATQVSYKSMQGDIAAITHFMDKVQEHVNIGLGIPLSYQENISCKLNKLGEITGILKDLKIDYMSLGGDVQLKLNKDKIVFDEPLDYSIVVPKLKEFAVLFG